MLVGMSFFRDRLATFSNSGDEIHHNTTYSEKKSKAYTTVLMENGSMEMNRFGQVGNKLLATYYHLIPVSYSTG